MADVLNVDEKTVARYAARAYDPLPVRVDHAGRQYIYQAALASWVNRQDLPFGAYSELQRRKRLPGQRRLAGYTETGRMARTPAQRAGQSKAARRNQR